MFNKILVANRGEIACRVIKTARRMGIRTVAVYSDADANARHVRLADEAVAIGPAAARESYLVIDKIIAAAKATGAQAIHPGYGFLSENEDFCEACEREGLVFIGPPVSAIRAMGSKSEAKKLMEAARVPLTPGYHGDNQDPAYLHQQADAIGYPVLIKAAAGGGGKGMRLVEQSADFIDALASCKREASSSFGDDHVLVEKYITRPRHIEIQVFGDTQGNVVYLFERDCSVQRRHQKVLEEAPAPGMTPERRAAMGQAAVEAARAVGYVGAGTVEFIANQDGSFYFMEMNTRLQVEHPVTEAVTGVDLVEWQFRVAAGEPIPMKQADIPLNGWAMEARLYAEDPANGFLPSIGKLEHFIMPDGVRVDTGVEQGGEVSQFYDPMIAKLIVHAETREEAAEALAEACAEVEVWPVRTNAGFLVRCLEHPRFVEGDVDTGLIGAESEMLTEKRLRAAVIAAGLADQFEDRRRTVSLPHEEETSPWAGWRGNSLGFRLNGAPSMKAVGMVDGERREAVLAKQQSGHADWYDAFVGDQAFKVAPGGVNPDRLSSGVWVDDELISTLERADVTVLFDVGDAVEVRDWRSAGSSGSAAASDGSLRAPMPGKIVATPAKPGDTVTKGQPVVVLEAMKMEHALVAPFDGVVGEISVSVGDQVSADMVLASVTAAG